MFPFLSSHTGAPLARFPLKSFIRRERTEKESETTAPGFLTELLLPIKTIRTSAGCSNNLNWKQEILNVQHVNQLGHSVTFFHDNFLRPVSQHRLKRNKNPCIRTQKIKFDIRSMNNWGTVWFSNYLFAVGGKSVNNALRFHLPFLLAWQASKCPKPVSQHREPRLHELSTSCEKPNRTVNVIIRNIHLFLGLSSEMV